MQKDNYLELVLLPVYMYIKQLKHFLITMLVHYKVIERCFLQYKYDYNLMGICKHEIENYLKCFLTAVDTRSNFNYKVEEDFREETYILSCVMLTNTFWIFWIK